MSPTFGQYDAGSPAPAETDPAAAAQPSEVDVLRQQNAEKDATIANLAGRTPQPAAPVVAAPVVIADMPEMPDAVADPPGFAAWHREDRKRQEVRTDQQISAAESRALQLIAQDRQTTRAQAITSQFLSQHTKFAAVPAEVQTVLSEAVTELGLTELPTPTDATALMTLAETKMNAKFTQMGVNAAPANRTAGVGGATMAAPTAADPEPEGEKLITMVEALKRNHRENGFFGRPKRSR